MLVEYTTPVWPTRFVRSLQLLKFQTLTSLSQPADTIKALTFSPKNYWLVAATDTSIKVWDLENKNVLDELQAKDPPKNGIPWCVSLCWSADGNMLFAGSTDGSIYVYEIGSA
jgi:guanine nucleotide-binding protein subunit beta-2-like 1 protein